jgi:hypothetical protein
VNNKKACKRNIYGLLVEFYKFLAESKVLASLFPEGNPQQACHPQQVSLI